MQLVAKNGTLTGTALPLIDGLTVSDPRNGSTRVRACCRIRVADDGRFVLHAVDRSTPVFVNGLPLTSRALQPRDEIRIGDSLFVVHADDPEPSPLLGSCSIRREPCITRPLLELRADDALLQHQQVEPSSRDARDLSTLMRVGAALSSVRGLAAIDAAVAGFVFDLIPAERVALVCDEEGGVVESAWTAPGVPASAVVLDPAVLDRVAAERVAMVVEKNGHDAVAVPLMAFGRATGVIWAEVSRRGAYDERHVRLLLLTAALAAVIRERERESARLQHSNELLQAEINIEHNMVGTSRPMRALFERTGRIARTESTVLVRGESGTGKELVARAVHRNSPRSKGPFIAINCAAITETLLESELFGHEKGAFTGAIGLKKGKLEIAHGGTLFLDEIGELPLTLQAKLLRALQEREFERVGGTRSVRVDFRLVAATNRDLEGAVKTGTFRQDLYYRLNVVTLTLPALRDRSDDVPVLASYFVRKHAPHSGRRVTGLAPDALARLLKHDWPGNVRELENVIEQALALGTGEMVSSADLPPVIGYSENSSSVLDYHETLERTRRDLIVRAFERAGHSHAAAARLLGVHPNYLHRLLRNLELRPVVTSGGRS